jgi:hypothetical protein
MPVRVVPGYLGGWVDGFWVRPVSGSPGLQEKQPIRASPGVSGIPRGKSLGVLVHNGGGRLAHSGSQNVKMQEQEGGGEPCHALSRVLKES